MLCFATCAHENRENRKTLSLIVSANLLLMFVAEFFVVFFARVHQTEPCTTAIVDLSTKADRPPLQMTVLAREEIW